MQLPFYCKLYVGTIDRGFGLGTGPRTKNAVPDGKRECSISWFKESAHPLSMIIY